LLFSFSSDDRGGDPHHHHDDHRDEYDLSYALDADDPYDGD
jgi:hypothetical protein